jgi:hypothetical protein
MQFERLTVSALAELVVWKSYCGGSHVGSLDDLRRYIESKRIGGITQAGDLFDWCGFAPVPNVRYTEDRLLETDTLWNTHRVSNLFDRPGYVYVLRESKPMATTEKALVTASVAAGAVVLGFLIRGALKPKALPAPPPPQAVPTNPWEPSIRPPV